MMGQPKAKRYIGKRRNYNTWPWKLLFALEAVWEWLASLTRRQPKIVHKIIEAPYNQAELDVHKDLHQRHLHLKMDKDQQPNPYGQYWKA